jgi:hypothetical protein
MFSLQEMIVYCLLSAFLMGGAFYAVLANPGHVVTTTATTSIPVVQTLKLPSGIEVLCIEGYKFVRDTTGNGSLVQFMYNGNYPKECE